MKNPFPGMNPYLETHWPDVHAHLIIYIIDQLQDKLPSDLRARAEEQVAVDEQGQRGFLRPDVHVNEPGSLHEPVLNAAGPNIAEPLIVRIEPETKRWVEILDADGRLITAIEALSSSNKSLEGQAGYRCRQNSYISSGVNLVEIDLLRKRRLGAVGPSFRAH